MLYRAQWNGIIGKGGGSQREKSINGLEAGGSLKGAEMEKFNCSC